MPILTVPKGTVIVTHDDLKFEPKDGKIDVPEHVAKALLTSHKGFAVFVPAQNATSIAKGDPLKK